MIVTASHGSKYQSEVLTHVIKGFRYHESIGIIEIIYLERGRYRYLLAYGLAMHFLRGPMVLPQTFSDVSMKQHIIRGLVVVGR
jgi:hypothetical protein